MSRSLRFMLLVLGAGFVMFARPADAQSGAGRLLITEFRLRGPNGPNDEFIEIYNNTGVDHTVAATSGSGYGIAASDGVTRCTIPNGTVIPPGGHFLCVNSAGYSLSAYPAGHGLTAGGDASFMLDIPDNAGIAIFNNDTGGESYSLGARFDAVGSTSEENPLYKEGDGYPALTPLSTNYAFVRDMCGKGGSIAFTNACLWPFPPRDWNDNAKDFLFVDTSATFAGVPPHLGSPGPENLSSPGRTHSSIHNLIDPSPLDTCASQDVAPNRVRDFTSDPANNSTFGTLDIRRTFTNHTGQSVTQLRFSIVDLTTFPVPPGIADLRPRTSTPVLVLVDREPCGLFTSSVVVFGTTLEQPPSQPNGGGLNSSMGVGAITLASPLANGASVDLRFLLGIQQTGRFWLYLKIDSLP